MAGRMFRLDEIPKRPSGPFTFHHTPLDWVEDAGHENGNYTCLCSSCGSEFIGHKRRVTCKVCFESLEARSG